MKRPLLCAVLSVALALTGAVASAASLHTYKTATGAQKHCPSDTVVWENTATGVYHMKGTKNYGTTKNGRYVCQQEADAAGLKPAANSQ